MTYEWVFNNKLTYDRVKLISPATFNLAVAEVSSFWNHAGDAFRQLQIANYGSFQGWMDAGAPGLFSGWQAVPSIGVALGYEGVSPPGIIEIAVTSTPAVEAYYAEYPTLSGAPVDVPPIVLSGEVTGIELSSPVADRAAAITPAGQVYGGTVDTSLGTPVSFDGVAPFGSVEQAASTILKQYQAAAATITPQVYGGTVEQAVNAAVANAATAAATITPNWGMLALIAGGLILLGGKL